MDDLLRDFLVETSESLDNVGVQLVRFEQEPDNQDVLRALFRLVHTVKGTCGFLGLPRLEALAHAAETVMGCFRDGAPVTRDAVTLILASVDRIKMILGVLDRTAAEPEGTDADLISKLELLAREPADAASVVQPDQSVGQSDMPAAAFDEPSSAQSTLRVQVGTLERLLTMVSELVLTRNQLLDVARQQSGHGFNAPLQRLSQVTTELQDCVMKTRMQPIGSAWHKLPRLIRDLEIELDKEIGLELIGSDTEIDRQVLDLIKDPITHLVRNAADHGVESREERLERGKPARGVITLSAAHVGGSIRVSVADDGRGLNHERIRAKAFERGLISESERENLTDEQIAQFIFHPGFSTASAITSISGRGVGLDVVHANVEQIGGAIDIQSRPGQGVIFNLSLPLTLAIVPALLVGAGGQQFAAPQSAVMELVHIDDESQARIDQLDGGLVLRMRGQLLPLVTLVDTLGIGAGRDEVMKGYVAILAVGAARFGLLVDQVFQTEEIVVKPMSTLLRHIQVYSGATVLGDGSVVLILDPGGLARAANLLISEQRKNLSPDEALDRRGQQGDATALLIFLLQGKRSAAPLSAIARLEEVQAKSIERAGGKLVTQYHGRLLPLVNAETLLERGGGSKSPCLILSHGGRHVGFIVDSIVDVIEQDIVFDGGVAPGVLGAAIIDGEAMDVVDALHHLRSAHPDIERLERASGPRRVLVVEDMAFFRDMIIPVLRGAGMRPSGADSLAAALAHADGPFDILVADPAAIDFTDAPTRASLGRCLAPSAKLIAWCDDFDALRRHDWSAFGVTAISKFDRRRLLSALGCDAMEEAA